MIKRGIFWILLLLCCQFSSLAQEMIFSAQSNARKIGTKDQFQVTYVLSNASGATNFRPPAFSGFSIVGGPYQSNSTSSSNINGQVRQTSSVNLTYVLVPNKAGVVTIPPARVTFNGKDVSSNSI